MKVIHEEGSRPIKMWVGEKPAPLDAIELYMPNIDESALKQLKNTAKLPFLHPHGLVVMPDVHAGKGSTVGSVIATQGAIMPAAVGVDIGCGMMAVRTTLKATDLPDSLRDIRHSIERGVPLGPGGRHGDSLKVDHMQDMLAPIWDDRLLPIKHAVGEKAIFGKPAQQLGTLGSGNHFIEVCLDQEQRVWVMLHSGSRGIGNMIGRAFIERAKKHMQQYFITLPDQDLAFFPDDTPDFKEYVAAVSWAQEYALLNREVMMREVLRNLHHHIRIPFDVTDEAINCHHNYVARETHFGKTVWLTRKGAIRARLGDLGIIPGSMGQRSFIVRGKGNPDSYHSCSHGAGRVMSRTQAGRTFTVEDLIRQTEGVECRKDNSVLDEIPSAYKDIDEVMALQADLVEIVHTLKQVMCVKGG